MNARAGKLRYAITAMAARYGEATLNYGLAITYGDHPDERARHLRAQQRRLRAVHRLADALAKEATR